MSSNFFNSHDSLPQELPNYTYVPGDSPHPVSDPRGHAFGQSRTCASGSLSTGATLFEYGYYWEAHEAWEAEWLAVPRESADALLIKGLIKLAACGVKCLERNRAGAIRHATRAAELFLLCDQPNSIALPEFGCQQLRARALDLALNPPLATVEQREAARSAGVPLLGPLLTEPATQLPDLRNSDLPKSTAED